MDFSSAVLSPHCHAVLNKLDFMLQYDPSWDQPLKHNKSAAELLGSVRTLMLKRGQEKTLARKKQFTTNDFRPSSHNTLGGPWLVAWLHGSYDMQAYKEVCKGKNPATAECDVQRARKHYSETNLADTPLAEYIWTRLGPFESVLDFGSGKGDAVRHYYERGAKIAVGVEVNWFGSLLYYADGWDCTDGPIQLDVMLAEYDGDQRLEELSCFLFRGERGGGFDVVTTTEVFEHIPRENHCQLANTLAKMANSWIVAGMAAINQGGDGHIANRMLSDFPTEWERRGFKMDRELSQGIHDGGASMPWNAVNAKVYKRVGPTVEVDCKEEDPFEWGEFQNIHIDKKIKGR